MVVMAVPRNEALVRRFYEEVWNEGTVEIAEEIFAPDYVRHDLRPTRAGPGGAGMAAIAAAFRGAFPDLRMEIDLILSDGDLVAARWTSTGTFSRPWGDASPTGVRATFSGVNIFRIRDGLVVELWNHRDDLGLMEQDGAPVFAGSPSDPDGPAADASDVDDAGR
jgi:predicted ester cyclase